MSGLKLFLPGTGGWFFLYLLALFLFVRPLLLLGDGGSCRHFLNGVYFFKHWHIPTTNYMSSLFPDAPAVTRCLIGDLFSGGAYWLWHLNGVVLVAAAALALALTWSYQFARARGLGALSGLLLLVLSTMASSMHWSSRCYVFSYLAFLGLYYVTFVANIGNRARLASTMLIMCLWANLHGSSTIGLFLLALKAVGDWLEASRGRTSAKWSCFNFLAGLAGTLLSLWSFTFYPHLIELFSNPAVVPVGNEWRSLDFSLGLPAWSFLVLFFVVMGLWIVSCTKPSVSEFLVVCGFFVAGLHTMRLIPYFVLLVLPNMGPAWSKLRKDCMQSVGQLAPGWMGKLGQRFCEVETRVESAENNTLPACLIKALVALGMIVCFVQLPLFKIKDFDPQSMPVKAVDYMSREQIGALGFVYDNWGGYYFWRTSQPIFFDDGVDLYPVTFVKEYIATMMAEQGWQDILNKYKLQWVLIPPSTLLGSALSGSPGWKLVFRDNMSELYIRENQGIDSNGRRS